MPFLQTLNLRSFRGPNGERRNSVSIGFSFSGETPKPITPGPLQLTGSQFVIDLSQFPHGNAIGAIRALQISAKFENNLTTPILDGSLYIFCPDTNHFVRLSAASPDAAGGPVAGVLTAVIPVATIAPTILQISKETASDNALHGDVYITAFDFDVPAYASQGNSWYVS